MWQKVEGGGGGGNCPGTGGSGPMATACHDPDAEFPRGESDCPPTHTTEKVHQGGSTAVVGVYTHLDNPLHPNPWPADGAGRREAATNGRRDTGARRLFCLFSEPGLGIQTNDVAEALACLRVLRYETFFCTQKKKRFSLLGANSLFFWGSTARTSPTSAPTLAAWIELTFKSAHAITSGRVRACARARPTQPNRTHNPNAKAVREPIEAAFVLLVCVFVVSTQRYHIQMITLSFLNP